MRLQPMILLATVAFVGCDDFPDCRQVINNCATDSCDISCGEGEEEACVGREFGDYDIGENERCCICVDPDRDYANE